MRADAHRTAAELLDDRPQQFAIDFVESVLVDLEQLQRGVGDVERDRAGRPHLRVVADATEQPVGDARRAARAPRELGGGAVFERHVENPGRPPDDLLQIALGVELEPVHDAETRSQRRRQQAGARRRPDERELLQRHFHRPGAGALADHDVELVVFERRIQNLLDRRRHPVNLVDEQHLAVAEVGENAREIAGLLEHRTRRRPDGHAELVADDIRQRRLAKAGRTVEQHVIERLAALLRRRDRHLEVLADAVLADVVVEDARAQPRFVLRVVLDAGGGHQAIVRHGRRVTSRALSGPVSACARNPPRGRPF